MAATVDNFFISDIRVLDIEKRYKPSKHYVYVIQVIWTNHDINIVYRRYCQFFDLQCKLLDLFPEDAGMDSTDRTIPFLPGKIIFGRSHIRDVALSRKGPINDYCQKLIKLPRKVSHCSIILDFFRPNVTDVQPPKREISDVKPSTSVTVISDPVQLPVYRCLDDFQAVEKTEMSLKKGELVEVIQKHTNGWWLVQHGDKSGFVPGPYLQPSSLPKGERETKTLKAFLNEPHVVNHSYSAVNPDELSIEKGAFVHVMEKAYTGWWRVNYNHSIGIFPAIYLTNCEGRTIEDFTPQISHRLPTTTNDVSSSNDSSSLQNFTPQENLTSKITHRNHLQHFQQEQSNNNQKEMAIKHDSIMDDNMNVQTNANGDPSKQFQIFYAHTDFADDVGDSVSFKRGQIIEVRYEHDSGWSFASVNGILAWIPSNYLQKEPILQDDDKSMLSSMTDNDQTSVRTSDTHYMNMPDLIQQTTKIDSLQRDNNETIQSIYQNINEDELLNNKKQLQNSSLKKQQIVDFSLSVEKSKLRPLDKTSVNIISLKEKGTNNSESNKDEYKKLSVKDMVKLFDKS